MPPSLPPLLNPSATPLQEEIFQWPCPLIDRVVFYEKLRFYGLFCQLQICQKCIGHQGSARTPEGAHNAPPDFLVGWGGGPVPMPHPLGASILAPSAVNPHAPSGSLVPPTDLELATVLLPVLSPYFK